MSAQVREASVSVEDVKALREGAGLYDASDHAFLSVSGPDATKFLQNMTANDVKNLPIGQLQYSALLNRKGMVESLFSVLRMDENSFLILLQNELKEKTLESLQKMRFIQELEMEDVTDKWGWIWVVGPRALEEVGDILGVHGDMLIRENAVLIPPDYSAWNLWQDRRWGVTRVCLLLPRNEVGKACDLLSHGDIVPVHKEALDLIRLEKGVPTYGDEIDETHIILEAALHDSYSRKKGCYPGQEVVERIWSYGDGKTPYKFNTYYVDGTVAVEEGMVKAIYDPSTDRTLIAAYVKR